MIETSPLHTIPEIRRLPSVGLAVLVCLAILRPASPLGAACEAWSSGGPFGGDVTAVAVAPTDSNTIYAATFGGVFKSLDGGVSWTVPTSDPLSNVTALAVDPGVSTTVFATGAFGVAVSDDGGATWSFDDLGVGVGQDVAIDPDSPSTAYATTDASIGLFKTTDGGATWAPSNVGLPAPYRVNSLEVDPVTTSTVYAVTEVGLYRSTDSGANWSEVTGTGVPSSLSALAIAPSDPQTLLAGGPNIGVALSSDGGASWTDLTTILTSAGLSVGLVQDVAIDPGDSDTLLVAGSTRLVKSTDSGSTWAEISIGSPSTLVNEVIVNASTSALWTATTRGVYTSADGGATWAPRNEGLSGTTVNVVRVDPFDSSVLYAGTENLGFFRSVDRGATWTAQNTGLTTSKVVDLVADPVSPGTLYAVGSGLPPVFRSTDGGLTWTPASIGLQSFGDNLDIRIDPATPSRLWAAGSGGVFRSLDGASTWSETTTGLTSTLMDSLAVDPTTPSTLYASPSSSGVFRSTDAGDLWTNIAAPFSSFILDLLVDRSSSTTIYAGTSDQGVWKSTDGGTTWNPASTGLTDLNVQVLRQDPEDPSRLYATSPDGVFVTDDGAATWQPLGVGLEQGVADLALDAGEPGFLHAGFFGRGVQSVFLDDPFELTGSASDGDDVCDAALGNLLPLGVTQDHRHCDEDWVNIGVPAGPATYRIETLGLSDSSDTTLTLFTGCDIKNPLGFNDNVDGSTFRSAIEIEAALSPQEFNVQIRQVGEAYEAGDSYQVRLALLRTLTITASANGTVTSDPAGIDCSNGTGDCSARFESGTVVTLDPTPEPGFAFSAWSGFIDCLDGQVTVSSDFGCSANFVAGSTLTVEISGAGSGTVTSDPDGIDCGVECSETFLDGTPVSLTATADEGSLFVGWSGDADCGDGEVVLDNDVLCRATFELEEAVIHLDGFETGNVSGWSSSVG